MKWPELCAMAGLPIPDMGENNENSPEVDKEFIIRQLKSYLTHLGYVPTLKDYRGSPSFTKLLNYGLTYTEAVQATGFSYDSSVRSRTLVMVEDKEQ